MSPGIGQETVGFRQLPLLPGQKAPGGSAVGGIFLLHQLLYNLYTDATLNTVWGDGTGYSATVSDTQLTAIHTVYGRIPARQNTHVGAYADTIVITLTF
jgi:hypothetical protein